MILKFKKLKKEKSAIKPDYGTIQIYCKFAWLPTYVSHRDKSKALIWFEFYEEICIYTEGKIKFVDGWEQPKEEDSWKLIDKRYIITL